VIEVSGRTYPVEIRYRPIEAPVRNVEESMSRQGAVRGGAAQPDEDLKQAALLDAVDELGRLGDGGILVFLPGEREIREAAEALRKHHPAHTEILPLFARLSVKEQERIFQPGNARRIVLSTNLAETSLTVPGIRYVVDTGEARVVRYSLRNKIDQLQTEPVSQAAANQRAGRCGRVAAGVCIRLYSELDFQSRPAFTDPEILRTSLAGTILRMKSLGLGEPEDFPFLDAPTPRSIAEGFGLLEELGAVDAQRKMSALGKRLARLPLEPRIGRVLLAAQQFACLREALVICAALSVQDPRERPAAQAGSADDRHRAFADERSDFMGMHK
jgi:ATP-dependent helicase HrpA